MSKGLGWWLELSLIEGEQLKCGGANCTTMVRGSDMPEPATVVFIDVSTYDDPQVRCRACKEAGK